MLKERSAFVISLDFELHWGVCDMLSSNDARVRMLGAREAIPRILDAFREYEIHATWAVVGLLFFDSKQQLLSALPPTLPIYSSPQLSTYMHLDDIGSDEKTDPLHYAPSLIAQIQRCPNQQIGTHTFSHYYALDHGSCREAFESDLYAAVQTAAGAGIEIRSIVFPRNQVHSDFVAACEPFNILAYRGNQRGWAYTATQSNNSSAFKRGVRLLDAYLPVFQSTFGWSDILTGKPVNIPASRFLRPFSQRYSLLEPLRKRRIFYEMTRAAKRAEIYHLWWHPHNFGVDIEENIETLHSVLRRFARLRDEYGMESLSMEEVAHRVISVQQR